MKTETRDVLIGTSAIAVVVVAYIFVVEPYLNNQASLTSAQNAANAAAANQAALTAATPGAGSTPSYNLPATLQLPPFNVGNAPAGTPGGSSISPIADNGDSGCGCGGNVCGTGSTGANSYFSQLLSFWGQQGGIQDNGAFTATGGASVLPVPATISAPVDNIVYANTFDQWAVKEGFNKPNLNITGTSSQRDMIPGSQNWTGAQQFQAYQLLQGGLFENAPQSDQRNVMQVVNAMQS